MTVVVNPYRNPHVGITSALRAGGLIDVQGQEATLLGHLIGAGGHRRRYLAVSLGLRAIVIYPPLN